MTHSFSLFCNLLCALRLQSRRYRGAPELEWLKRDKLKEKLLSGDQDKNFDFDELCTLVLHLGFTERKKGKGSHRIFYRKGVEEIINLQPTSGNKAKPYQVRQVRQILNAHSL